MVGNMPARARAQQAKPWREAAAAPTRPTFELRSSNLTVERASRSVTLRGGTPQTIEWRARPADAGAPWAAVVIPDGDVTRRRDVPR